MANPREHIFLSRIDMERPRHKRPGMSTPIARDNVKHGLKISESITKIRQEYEKVKQKTPLSMEPVLVFSIKAEQKINEDDLRRSGLTVLDEDAHKTVFVLTQDVGLDRLEKRVEEYSQELTDGKKPKYNWLGSLSGQMESTTPKDRMGPKLRREGIDPNKEYRVDIEFWSVNSRDENQRRIERLTDYAQKHNGRVLDTFVGRLLSIARLKISSEFLLPLLEEPTIRLIDLPPTPATGTVQLLRTSYDEFPHPMTDPPSGALGICIIDSGVMPGHPMLRNAIGETRAFPVGDAIDTNGHGTMVAGIALYGDVKSCIDGLSFEPSFYLYSARVLNSFNRFDDDRLIVTQMQEAIEYFNRHHECRIFNISIGDPELVYEDGKKPSSWANILDTLARDLNVVIIVSAGNFEIVGYGDDTAVNLYQSFPYYFLNGNKQTRIIEPACAANVITVGSLAHTDKSYYAERYPHDLEVRPIASINDVSPFTRCGPGVNNAIKPDVCEYGGNVLWRGVPGIIQQDSGLGVVSTNIKFTDSLFGTDIGSSFAAPKVAHLAAKILQKYPDISANLVRALIANSASIPDIAHHRFTDEDDLLKLYGYGKPQIERAIFSDDNRVTLVADETIALDGLHLYEIPIPDEFKNEKGARNISVALAYDPPVRNRLDYLGVKMSFRLFRGLERQQIINWHAERPQDANPDKILDRYQCSMTPSPTRRESGTLQKAVFRAVQNKAFTDYSNEDSVFHLLVTSQSAWATSDQFPNQRYGLVVTIEHEDAFIQLYNLVEQRIQARERVRVRG